MKDRGYVEPIDGKYPVFQPELTMPACSEGGWEAVYYKSEVWNARSATGSFEDVDAAAILLKNQQKKLAVLVFAGSEPPFNAFKDKMGHGNGVRDWVNNAQCKLRPIKFGNISVNVHWGFHQTFVSDVGGKESLGTWCKREVGGLPKSWDFVITGHSLGGAMATMGALFSATEWGRKPSQVITFAAPSSGGDSFVKAYQDTVGCDRTLRVISRGDSVDNVMDYLPLHYGNYSHVCGHLKVDATAVNGLVDPQEGMLVQIQTTMNAGAGAANGPGPALKAHCPYQAFDYALRRMAESFWGADDDCGVQWHANGVDAEPSPASNTSEV